MITATTIICLSCNGRRYVKGLLCEHCNGNGRVPVIHRDPREIARRNMTIAVLILSVILAIAVLA